MIYWWCSWMRFSLNLTHLTLWSIWRIVKLWIIFTLWILMSLWFDIDTLSYFIICSFSRTTWSHLRRFYFILFLKIYLLWRILKSWSNQSIFFSFLFLDYCLMVLQWLFEFWYNMEVSKFNYFFYSFSRWSEIRIW